MKLRRAGKNDLDNIVEMFEETVRNTCHVDYSAVEIEAWIGTARDNRLKWAQKIEEQYFIVAEAEGQLMGFGSLGEGGYIDFMYTHKDAQRKGVAMQVYLALEEEAQRLGENVLSSDVSLTARPFFEHLGFRVIHKNENHRKGQVLINYHMEKRLAGA